MEEAAILNFGQSYSSTSPLDNILSNGHDTVMPWYNQPLGLKARGEGWSTRTACCSRDEPLPLNCLPLPWQLSAAGLFGVRWQADTRSVGRLLPGGFSPLLIRMEALQH